MSNIINVSEVAKPKVYAQNWQAYNKSQIEEKERFMQLLNGLLVNLEEQSQSMGRPRISQHDAFFASALKVYSQFSLRRFMSDLRHAKEEGYITTTPCFASVGHFIQNPAITQILLRLIQLSSLPLKDLEVDFAVDSSGFRTTKFTDYCRERHEIKQKHEWLKCHIITGVKTNIVVATKIGFEHHSADSPQFIPLVKTVKDLGFEVKEVSADKAYLARSNFDAVAELGGIAYIPFKENNVQYGKGSRVWNKMFYYFQMCKEEYLEHYHKRSNVETTFFMIKSKFNDLLKSKSREAQVNELLLKILCHNIVVLVHEMNEFGIDNILLNGYVSDRKP